MHPVKFNVGWSYLSQQAVRRRGDGSAVGEGTSTSSSSAGWLRGPRRHVWSSLNLNLWTDESSQQPASFQPLITERQRQTERDDLRPFKSVFPHLSLPPLVSFTSFICFFSAFFKLLLWYNTLQYLQPHRPSTSGWDTCVYIRVLKVSLRWNIVEPTGFACYSVPSGLFFLLWKLVRFN